MARSAHPELDIGEITGSAFSFLHQFYPKDDYPFIPALHQAYRQHRTLDPTRAAIKTGIAMIGTVPSWALGDREEVYRGIAMSGLELIRLARDEDEKRIKQSLLKHLFLLES